MDRPYGTPRAPTARRGPLAPDLSRATSHAFADADTIRAHGERRLHGSFYPRYGHVNARAFESFVAECEGADGAVSFASGMAAIHAVALGLCSAGDRVIAANQVYGGTAGLLKQELPRFGIEVDRFDVLDLAALDRALERSARLCMVETPINPTLRLCDLEAIATRCHAKGVTVMVDGTFAPPPIQYAIRLGVDLVVHSATKFLGGHSDTLAGVVAGRHELLAPIETFRARTGAILSPDSAWLLCRSAETHGLRVLSQQGSATWLAQRLSEQSGPDRKIRAVHHPALPDHPDADIQRRQMAGGGALLSIVVAGGLPAAMAAFDRLMVVARAPSLGGVESNASLPAHTTHAALTPRERGALGIDDGMIRISIGLEDRERILADILQAIGEAAAGAVE